MKFFSIFVVFLACFCNLGTFSKELTNNALGRAFANISAALSKQNYLVTVIMSGEPSDKADSTLFSNFAEIPHIVAAIDDDPEKFNLSSSAIVWMESTASLKRFNMRAILAPTFSTFQQVFIYCQDGTVDEIVKAPMLIAESPILLYEYFVVEEEKIIRLLTFVQYTPEECNAHQLTEVNKFEKSLGRWQHGSFQIDKSSNFHKCDLTFLIEGGMPSFWPLAADDEQREITECVGYFCSMVKDFSFSMNYTYYMNMIYEDKITFPEQPFELYLYSATLNVKPIADSKLFRVATRSFYFVEHFFSVPPGKEFNGYEKMVLPFDEPTWLWIGITFTTAFVSILVLRLVPDEIAEFVMGRDTATPALNVLRAFFGISQIVCPGRNFARYLLMIFILFSLIIRTAYQGKMFEFLQKDMRKPTLTTVDEMIDENFTFYIYHDFTKYNQDSDLVKRGNVIDNWTFPELYTAYKRSYIPESKTSVFYNQELYLHVIRGNLHRIEPPKLLADRYWLEHRAITLPPHHFLFDVLDRKLQQYIEADLINYNANTRFNNPKNYEESKEPYAILTLDELEAGFMVCLLPLVLSILVFIIEWIPTLKDLVVFLIIFKNYFALKEAEGKTRIALMSVKVAAWQASIAKK